MTLSYVLSSVMYFYTWLIIIYVLMSWIPSTGGTIGEIRRVLGTLVEPYLGLFKRVIPPIGMIDISPIAAILVLQILRPIIAGLGF